MIGSRLENSVSLDSVWINFVYLLQFQVSGLKILVIHTVIYLAIEGSRIPYNN